MIRLSNDNCNIFVAENPTVMASASNSCPCRRFVDQHVFLAMFSLFAALISSRLTSLTSARSRMGIVHLSTISTLVQIR